MGKAKKHGNGNSAAGGPPHTASGFFKARQNLKETAKNGSGTTAGVQAGMRTVFEATSRLKRQDKVASRRAIQAFVPEVTYLQNIIISTSGPDGI